MKQIWNSIKCFLKCRKKNLKRNLHIMSCRIYAIGGDETQLKKCTHLMNKMDYQMTLLLTWRTPQIKEKPILMQKNQYLQALTININRKTSHLVQHCHQDCQRRLISMAATFLNLLLKDRSQDLDKKLMQAKSNQWFPLIVQGDMRQETKTWIRLALLQWVLILLQM